MLKFFAPSVHVLASSAGIPHHPPSCLRRRLYIYSTSAYTNLFFTFKISLGPSGRSLGGMSWGRGSTGGLGNSGSASQEQEVPGNR